MIDNQKQITLLKDLPSCPKGRIFISDINGDYFHSMTDKEYLEGNLKSYKYTKEEMNLNPKWFSKPVNRSNHG